MKHIGRVTVVLNASMVRRKPLVADATTDFMNGLWRVWSDYVYEKKNEFSVG